MSSNAEKNLYLYKENTKKSGEQLVKFTFPERVFEMEELLKSSHFDDTIKLNGTITMSDNMKMIPVNAHLKSLMETIKPLIIRLMDEALQVRLWIQFNIPKIEDGNNFGVGIQEEALAEAANIERDACAFLEQMSRYHVSRGRVLAKVQKFPQIEDYVACVIDLDRKQSISLKYIIMEIRNHYAILHDLINKNIDRIKLPRSDNSINMY